MPIFPCYESDVADQRSQPAGNPPETTEYIVSQALPCETDLSQLSTEEFIKLQQLIQEEAVRRNQEVTNKLVEIADLCRVDEKNITKNQEGELLFNSKTISQILTEAEIKNNQGDVITSISDLQASIKDECFAEQLALITKNIETTEVVYQEKFKTTQQNIEAVFEKLNSTTITKNNEGELEFNNETFKQILANSGLLVNEEGIVNFEQLKSAIQQNLGYYEQANFRQKIADIEQKITEAEESYQQQYKSIDQKLTKLAGDFSTAEEDIKKDEQGNLLFNQSQQTATTILAGYFGDLKIESQASQEIKNKLEEWVKSQLGEYNFAEFQEKITKISQNITCCEKIFTKKQQKLQEIVAGLIDANITQTLDETLLFDGKTMQDKIQQIDSGITIANIEDLKEYAKGQLGYDQPVFDKITQLERKITDTQELAKEDIERLKNYAQEYFYIAITRDYQPSLPQQFFASVVRTLTCGHFENEKIKEALNDPATKQQYIENIQNETDNGYKSLDPALKSQTIIGVLEDCNYNKLKRFNSKPPIQKCSDRAFTCAGAVIATPLVLAAGLATCLCCCLPFAESKVFDCIRSKRISAQQSQPREAPGVLEAERLEEEVRSVASR